MPRNNAYFFRVVARRVVGSETRSNSGLVYAPDYVEGIQKAYDTLNTERYVGHELQAFSLVGKELAGDGALCAGSEELKGILAAVHTVGFDVNEESQMQVVLTFTNANSSKGEALFNGLSSGGFING